MIEHDAANGTSGIRPGIRVALVDTGIAGDHPLLCDRVIAAIDCDPLAGVPPRPLQLGAGRDRNTHGTGLASVIAALAPEAELVDVAVLDHRVSCTCEALVAALRYLVAGDIELDIVNLSLEVANPSVALIVVLAELIDRGITVIQARREPRPIAEATIPIVAGGWDDPFRVEPIGLGLAARGRSTVCVAPGGGYSHQRGASLAAATVTGITAAYLARGPARPGALDAPRLLAALARDAVGRVEGTIGSTGARVPGARVDSRSRGC